MSSNNSLNVEDPTENTIQHLNRSKQTLSELSAKLTDIDKPAENIKIDIDPLVSILAHKPTYKVVIVGSTAVENAIVEALTHSSFNIEIHVLGNTNNPGIQNLLINKSYINITDKTEKIVEYAEKINADIVIVNSDHHIEFGIADLLYLKGIKCFGPRIKSAIIQTDKTFVRTLLTSYDMNHFNPQYLILSSYNENEIIKIFDSLNDKFQIRNPKLSYAKGTKLMNIDFKTRAEALEYCSSIINTSHYGVCLIEAIMEGDQFTMASFVDGRVLYHMPIMQEYIRLENKDTGVLTNGMGCVSMTNHSMPFLNDTDVMTVHNINNNVVAALFQETGQEYYGVIKGNFIKLKNGEIKVVDYKCSLGDPYGINLLKIMKTDFMEVCLRVINSSLKYFDIECRNIATCSIYTVPIGYPNTRYQKREIYIDSYNASDIMFANVTYIEDNEAIILLGSRAIAVIGHGITFLDAKNHAMNNIKKIHGPLQYRKDIGDHYTEFNGTCISNFSSNVDKSIKVIESIREQVETTQNKRVVSSYGDFCSVIKGDAGHYSFSINGVGTKGDLVLRYSEPKTGYYSLGRDLVFNCVANVLTKGTLPFAFLDSISTSSIDPENVKYLINGIASACRDCNCVLIDGKTCELPYAFAPGKIDMMGFMIGYSPLKKKLFHGSNVKAGDLVYAICSTGPHTNGYDIIRKIIDESTMQNDMSKAQFAEFCKWIITEHGNYMPEINALISSNVNIRAIAHITDGGLIKNPARIVPNKLCMLLNKTLIDKYMPHNFRLLAHYGDIDEIEIFNTFNCGIGMLVVVSSKYANNIQIINKIQKWNHIWQIGSVIERTEGKSAVEFYTSKK
jgi:phosphoribosylamine--glycine ligase/phosphoribosylaminoimidazole synthetase